MPRPTPEEIALLLARFDASSWDELDLELGDFRLVLSTSTSPVAAPSRSAASPGSARPAEPEPEPVPSRSLPKGHQIKAPSLGRFWSKPKPTDPPFVSVGTNVKAGDVVCLVEVMKLFTQVKSDVTGKVVAVPVTDGAMVEHDDVLVVIEVT